MPGTRSGGSRTFRMSSLLPELSRPTPRLPERLACDPVRYERPRLPKIEHVVTGGLVETLVCQHIVQ